MVFNKNAYLSSLFIKGHVFFARKKEHKKKTETRLSISVQICSCQLLFLKYRISIQINHNPPVHNVKTTSRINPAVLRFFFPPLLIYFSPFSASIAFRSFLNIFSKPLFAESMVSETLSFKRSFFSCFSAASVL